MVIFLIDSEAHPQNPLLPFIQVGENLLRLPDKTGSNRCIQWRDRFFILNNIPQAIILFAESL